MVIASHRSRGRQFLGVRVFVSALVTSLFVALFPSQMAHAAKKPICSKIVESLSFAWHSSRSEKLQEGLRIRDQHLAKISDSEEDLIIEWFQREERKYIREARLAGRHQTHWGIVLPKQIRFVSSIRDWQDLTNQQLRDLLTIESLLGASLPIDDIPREAIELWNQKIRWRKINIL